MTDSALQEAKTDNELIAEFMGGKRGKYNVTGIPYYSNLPYGTHVVIGKLRYHEKWDWLMPVVEKIRDLNCMVSIRYNRKLNTTTTQIHGFMDRWVKDMEFHGVGIESTYKACVEFIKWHQQQQSNG